MDGILAWVICKEMKKKTTTTENDRRTNKKHTIEYDIVLHNAQIVHNK